MPTTEELCAENIHIWLENYSIKNEQGVKLDFINHAFMWAIFEDMSPVQAVLKAPQVGMTTLEILKSFWVAKYKRRDIIYTLPTQSDVNDMAGGKINRLVAQNPILSQWVKDHDTVNQKNVGESIIYYRGTFSGRQAMMVPSGLNIHDEVDASDGLVLEQYETRLQARTDGMRWYFSHPSAPDRGIDIYWQQSDQKHWFITCPHCKVEQYLSWPESIDPERKCYQCKRCKGVLADRDRRQGRWIKRYDDKQVSGYWISQLMCPWITAEKILNDFKEKTPEYFWNYVLGLPYAGGDSKLTQGQLFQNLTGVQDAARDDERVVIGVDTGLKLDYVLGNERLGLFFHGEADGYGTLDVLMRRWKNAIAIVDAGGDLIGSRSFMERWAGRVFLCYTGGEQRGVEIVRWGKNEENQSVHADRNRCIQLVVDEFRLKRLPLQGAENDWWEYWLDWKNMSRIKIFDDKGEQASHAFKGIKWIRNGRDHRAMATVYWRIGMMRFSSGDQGAVLGPPEKIGTQGYTSKDGAAVLPLISSKWGQ